MAIEFRRLSARLPAGRPTLAAFALASVACSAGAGEAHEDEQESSTVREERAVLKFCNDLEKGGQDVTLTLEVGYPDPVRISALSGTCAPQSPAACARIPAGTNVPATLRDGHQVIAQATLDHVASGAEWLLVAGLDERGIEPEIQGGELKPEYRCSEVE